MKIAAFTIVVLLSVFAASVGSNSSKKSTEETPAPTATIDYIVYPGVDDPNQVRTQLQRQSLLHETVATSMIG